MLEILRTHNMPICGEFLNRIWSLVGGSGNANDDDDDDGPLNYKLTYLNDSISASGHRFLQKTINLQQKAILFIFCYYRKKKFIVSTWNEINNSKCSKK